jgi:hypothetical protein
MKKMIKILTTVFCCSLIVVMVGACEGTAESGAGADSDSSMSQTLTFRVQGYQSPPDLYCAAKGVEWEPIPFSQNGTASLEVSYLPQDVFCNIEVAPDQWVVNSDGVCQGYHFFVNDKEVTTWQKNTHGGRNYSFRVANNGQVELIGNNIVFTDCSTNSDPDCQVTDLQVGFSGYQSGQTATLYCAGDGLGWESVTLDSNGQADLSVCPAVFQCNVKVGNSWAVRSDGVCQDYIFVVNGTTITTGVAALSGGQNYAFEVLADQSVQLYGDSLEQVDCSASSGDTACAEPLELDFKFSGYSQGDSVTLYCSGNGLAWGETNLDANGQTSLTGCPGVFECNLEISPGNWAVRSDGVCQDYIFVVNGTTITTGVAALSGGQNYAFELLAGGTVELWGSSLEQIDCSGNTGNPDILCDLELVYQGTYQDPILKITGGGLSWDDDYHFVSDGDTMSVLLQDVHPDIYYANMDMLGNGSLWYVNHQGILSGNSLSANDVWLDYWESNDMGGGNLVFTLTDACEVGFPE